MTTDSIPQELALRKDQIKAGFSVSFAECRNYIIVRRNGLLFRRYGQMTPQADIHKDIDNAIELGKSLGLDPYKHVETGSAWRR